MKNILVAVDFSDNSINAIEAAKKIAKKSDANLILLHAYQPYIPDIPHGAATLSVYNEAQESYQKQLDEQVETIQGQGYKAEGIWSTELLLEALQEVISTKSIDLLVIGRTGKGGFLDKLFGSFATNIITEIKSVPVLVVPPNATTSKYNEIVYATQLEYEENDVVRKVIDFTNQIGGRLSFLKVSSLTQPNIQDDNQYLEQLKAEFNLTNDDFVLRESGSVIKGIEEYLEEVKADIFVVATRERGFLEQLLINPSISKQLVLSTSTPMLVYHLS